MPVRDVSFEAAFLRAALLVGLVHERDVPEWAIDLISIEDSTAERLADVLVAPVELSPMREVLRPLATGADPQAVAGALLTSIALSTHSATGAALDSLRVLDHLRKEKQFNPPIAEAIEAFAQRAWLSGAGVRGNTAPSGDELAAWLNAVRPASYFLITIPAIAIPYPSMTA
jgi:hypothetical protein